MEKKKNSNLTPEEQEKKDIELENNILKILLPSFGATAFILGLVGFILTIAVNPDVGIFLLIIAILGLGGIAYGVYHLILKQRNKLRKEEYIPSDKPNEKQKA